jgi:hypothetical protein
MQITTVSLETGSGSGTPFAAAADELLFNGTRYDFGA